MFTPMPSLEEDGLHSLSSKTASSAAVGTYGRFDGERSRSGGSIGRRKQDSQRRCKLRVIYHPRARVRSCSVAALHVFWYPWYFDGTRSLNGVCASCLTFTTCRRRPLGRILPRLVPLSSEHVATTMRSATVVDLLRTFRSLLFAEDEAGAAERTTATTELLRAVSLGGADALQQITDRQASDSERAECAGAVCIIELLQLAHGLAAAHVGASGKVGAAERATAVLRRVSDPPGLGRR